MTTGKAETLKKVAVALNASYKITVSPETVQNVLRQADLKAREKVKKPAIATRHRKSWLEFAISCKR